MNQFKNLKITRLKFSYPSQIKVKIYKVPIRKELELKIKMNCYQIRHRHLIHL